MAVIKAMLSTILTVVGCFAGYFAVAGGTYAAAFDTVLEKWFAGLPSNRARLSVVLVTSLLCPLVLTTLVVIGVVAGTKYLLGGFLDLYCHVFPTKAALPEAKVHK